jgi:hypothetical protein
MMNSKEFQLFWQRLKLPVKYKVNDNGLNANLFH